MVLSKSIRYPKPQTTFSSTNTASQRRRPTRPPRLRSFAVKPQGPRIYRADPLANSAYQQFFVPPPGFLASTNSRSEWTIYVAIAKALGAPRDPRVGPFVGYPGIWTYQSPVEGGRAARGGQVVDFVVHGTGSGNGDVYIRIQTERFHVLTDAPKHAQDQILLTRLAQYGRVANIYEQDFMNDKTGQAAVIEVKKAIFGGTSGSPLAGGRARRLRL